MDKTSYSIPSGSFAAQTSLVAPLAGTSVVSSLPVDKSLAKEKRQSLPQKGSERSYWIKSQIKHAPLQGSQPVLSVQCLAHIYASGHGIAGGQAEQGMGSSVQTTFLLTDLAETKVLGLHESLYSFQVRFDVEATEWEPQPRDGALHGTKRVMISIAGLSSNKPLGPFEPSAFSFSIPAAKPS